MEVVGGASARTSISNLSEAYWVDRRLHSVFMELHPVMKARSEMKPVLVHNIRLSNCAT